ncbi:SDR family NAD(P)-dependent oxidoreductase [Bradyrhizobium sp. Ash2021]|uniref:SDR family NAD(P)-dependent oxidoreductase n=1 Tax=Bradyrhizobium sp. Ash2021 TaxID=2954771 RepID=UPI0035C1F05B
MGGKVALVTGAAGEIGAATVGLLAERGSRIVAIDCDCRRVEARGRGAHGIRRDVTREDDVAAYAPNDGPGSLHIFFNNAGIEGDVAAIPDYPLEAFRRVLDVNVVGVFLGMKYVIPVMTGQDAGSIINTASIAGLIGSSHIVVHSASKNAVIGLTKSATLECANTQVRVGIDRQPHAVVDHRWP